MSGSAQTGPAFTRLTPPQADTRSYQSYWNVPPFSDWTPPGEDWPGKSEMVMFVPAPRGPLPTFFAMMSPVLVLPLMVPTDHFRVGWLAGRPGGVNMKGVAAKPTGPVGPVPGGGRSSRNGPVNHVPHALFP